MQTDVMHPDLFVGESPIVEPAGRPLKVKMPDGGHAATPGSGPVGMECWQCENSVLNYECQGRAFLKCDCVPWGPDPETDISESDAACLFFKGPPSTSALNARTLQDILEGK